MTGPVFTRDVVAEITTSVWSAFLAQSEDIVPLALAPSRPPVTETPIPGPPLTGSVCISGQWNGIISLSCSSAAAHQAAALMFDAEPGQVGQPDVLDAVAELVNVVGGNLKGMLPSPTGLSLPSVTEGTLHVDTRVGAELLIDVQLSWLGEPVSVAIWSKDGPPLPA